VPKTTVAHHRRIFAVSHEQKGRIIFLVAVVLWGSLWWEVCCLDALPVVEDEIHDIFCFCLLPTFSEKSTIISTAGRMRVARVRFYLEFLIGDMRRQFINGSYVSHSRQIKGKKK
jgi:hypothetical protein